MTFLGMLKLLTLARKLTALLLSFLFFDMSKKFEKSLFPDCEEESAELKAFNMPAPFLFSAEYTAFDREAEEM